jgi:hypothetical protein
MTVSALSNEFVKLYSIGKEIGYNGTTIEYADNTNTFLIFYYHKYCRLYVINGKKENQNLVQVKEKINIEAIYSQIECKRLVKFIKEKREDEFLYFINPLFFKEINTLLKKKNYLSYINYIYDRYKERVKV